MTLPKAVGYMIILLAIYYSLENQGYRQSLNVFFEKLMGTKESHIYTREKRLAALNSSEYIFQGVINISDVDRLRTLLSTLPEPLLINGTIEITSIEVTTVCSSVLTGYQCRCEQSYAWSYNNCINYGACDAILGDTCGCINATSADGQYCQKNTSQPVTMTTTSSTPQNASVEYDLVLDVRIPYSSASLNYIPIFRNILRITPFPRIITPSLTVIDLNFTTGCYSNSTGGPQCQCEEQFAWSCDKCNTYGSCSNSTTCQCINGLPSDGEFCQPITSVTLCPPPTPENTTTTTQATTTSATTTQMTTTTTQATASTSTTTHMTTTTSTLTSTTTTTTTTSTTTTTTVATPTTTTITTISERNLSLAMDIAFNPAYNNPSHKIYQDVHNAILKQSEEYITNLKSVELIRFRNGSTIVDYTIRAPAFQETDIQAVREGIFSELAETYPMIFDSSTYLTFESPFFGKSATVTCGPISQSLNFSDNWTAEWRRDSKLILQDSEHSFSQNKEKAMLTVSKFFVTDEGVYECRLKNKNIFRQKSNGVLSFKTTPLIQVTPLRQKVKCEVGKNVSLQCSVNNPYKVKFTEFPSAGTDSKISHMYFFTECESQERKFTCEVANLPDFKNEIILQLSTEDLVCVKESIFGVGKVGDKGVAPCEANEVGEKIAYCKANGNWEDVEDNCILQQIKELLDQSQFLNTNSLQEFLQELSIVTLNFTKDVVESTANINAIVEILINVAKTSLDIPISRALMKDILLTAGVLTTGEAKNAWDSLNARSLTNSSVTRNNISTVKSVSSSLLSSLEIITSNLNNDSFDIDTPHILLNKTTFTDTFIDDFNSSVEVNIQEAGGGNKSVTVITFSSMDNVLPARDEDNSTFNDINGRVVLVYSSGTVNNVSFVFDVINNTLGNPQCVFWNFSLFDGLGGWDDEGCVLTLNINGTVTCNCNHLTSFSILMSPFSLALPVLDYITYIGVGISMGSLVICLIIEAVIWRKIRRNNTSYLRHVSIVNIALSLLIADIWFIIGAAISNAEAKNPPACTAATFFIHFFYLALFFWMFASALLLLYRTVSVFDGGLSKTSMMAIGFSLGYGVPLIIVIITIAVTAPKEEYIRESGVCWLNWHESKALLAFVIPALTIVAINLGILLVVIYKMLRRRVVGDSTTEERHVLVVIARSLAVLTPFFGITWGLGVGTMTDPNNIGIHIAFAFFNSLQGFFILVFGTLLDKKVRMEMAIKSQTSRSGTGSTSAGTSSSNGLGFLRNWRRGRDGYNVSSYDTGASHSFSNT